jgi:signal transduction histidine kinase
VEALNVQLGFFAHELRNFLYTANLALYAIRDGNLGIAGATGTVLDRALLGMRTLIDRSLTTVRITAGLPVRNQLFSLADFIEELKLSANLEARERAAVLSVAAVDPSLAVDADRDLLQSAVGNLLQNAFKFTRPGTEVLLNAYSAGDRVRIDVEDHGEGLSAEDAEMIFEPFTQRGSDRSGLGLGLSIARRSVEANAGFLTARNKPHAGCIFTIDLPRRAVPVS